MLSILDYLNIGVALAVVATYAYVLYSSLAIRRTLGSGLYRRQALGMGLIAVGFSGMDVANFIPYNGVLGLLGGVIFYSATLIFLYWVDSSILASRRSDPLDRDTFRWSKVRIVIWIAAVSLMVITLGTASFFTETNPGNIPDFLNLFFLVVFPLPIFLAAISGVIIIPIASRRSRDLTLRKHLQWFFLFIAIQLVLQGGIIMIFFSSDFAVANLLDGIALLIGFYPLYQSVKRLVPLYTFSLGESPPLGALTGASESIPT